MCCMNAIHQLRKQLKLSQNDLASEIGVTQSAVSQFEAGVNIPSPETARKLIEFAKKRGIKLSFELVYAKDLNGDEIERIAAMDDAQNNPGGRVRKNRKN
jgi:putative transcriptional regulator